MMRMTFDKCYCSMLKGIKTKIHPNGKFLRNVTRTLTVLLILSSIFLLVMPVQSAKAVTIDLGWEFPGGYTLAGGAVGSDTVNLFNVTDDSFSGNGFFDSIPVT